MSILFNRALSAFKGSAVVVGCSHGHTFCNKGLHQGEDVFFTIDRNGEETPDVIFDITKKELPEELRERFKLTLLECIDYTAYNASPDHQGNDEGIQGFNNVWDMTSEDGFIVIVGCPPEKNFRERIVARNLKYIELDNDKASILIAKNQALNIHEITEQLENLDQPLKKSIHKIKNLKQTRREAELKFCDTPYEQMDGFEKLQAEVMELKEHPQELIEAFKKIYLSLYAGQTSLFKSKPSILMTCVDLTIADINHYTWRHPNSRSAYAWNLATKHWKDPTIQNKILFHDIHQYAYQHSSNFLGFFKQTKNLSENRDFTSSVQHAPTHSRTGLIRDTLSA